MDHDELMERQRRRVKHRYYRTIDGISKARELVQSLTQQHQALLAQHTLKADPEANPADDPPEGRNHALQQYIEATALVDELRKEKQRLTKLVDERDKLQVRLVTLLDQYHSNAVTETSALVGFVVPPISFIKLTEEDCAEIVRWSYASIQRFVQSQSFTSTNSGVFGWRDRRRLNGSVMEMLLQKQLYGFTPLELALETWKLLQGKIEFTKLFSPALGATMQCVQVINDTNMVIYNHFASVRDQGSFQVLYLASLVKIDHGYATLFQSVDRSRFIFKDEAPSGCKWLDLHRCYLFQEHEGQERVVDVTFGGKVEAASARRIESWMLELLLTSMRWETRIVSPRTLLWSE